MRAVCIDQPISWLRLERYRLGELSGTESRAIEQHLQHCPTCQSCYAETAVELELPPLPQLSEVSLKWPSPPPRVHFSRNPFQWLRGWRAVAIAFTAVTCVFSLWVYNPFQPVAPHTTRPALMRVKGGTLSLQLVRQRDNAQSSKQQSFRPGDRFKLLLTSPPKLGSAIAVVVYQDQRAYFPLALSQPPVYGNHIPLPGSIALDGDAPADICVAVGGSNEIAQHRLAQGPEMLPQNAVCVRVVPQAANPDSQLIP